MQKQGIIRSWNADRGFGFIDSGDSNNVFVHVRDIAHGLQPVEGLKVVYEEIQVGGKGPRATAVRAIGAKTANTANAAPTASAQNRNASAARTVDRAPRRDTRVRPSAKPSGGATGGTLAMVLMIGWLGLLGFGVWTRQFPGWLAISLVLLNLVTFVVYWVDKNAAQNGAWRVPEKNLHLLALLGGWPAAWWAQQWLRHKSSKHEFRVKYWATVIGNCAVLAAIVWLPGLDQKLPALFRG